MKPKRINSRSKGIRGERLLIDWLQPHVNATVATARGEGVDCPDILLQRNTLQSDVGGCDLAGLPWLAAEVKNCADDPPALVASWWQQCQDQAKPGQTAVLFYKVARRPFRVRMAGGWGEGLVWNCGHVEIAPEQFLAWFKTRLRADLGKQKPPAQ